MVEKIISTCITAYSQSVELRLLDEFDETVGEVICWRGLDVSNEQVRK